ncbi:MAG: GNAT family N-acetyltransferase [Chloroflexota bacterium]
MVIKGNNVYLRTIRETDLDWLYDHMTDVELRGQYFPISIPSETEFKGNFHKHGYWSDDYGMLLIADAKDNRVLGTIMRFKATPYWDNYEVGYRLLDLNLGGRGIMTEALMLFTYVPLPARPLSTDWNSRSSPKTSARGAWPKSVATNWKARHVRCCSISAVSGIW